LDVLSAHIAKIALIARCHDRLQSLSFTRAQGRKRLLLVQCQYPFPIYCDTEDRMNPATPTTEQETQSFAETAMRMGGKSEEESGRTGAVDKADEQVDRLFRYQTANSPIHKAIWDGKVPLELFATPPLPASAPCDAVMEKSLAVVKRRREQGTLLNQD